jgi:cytochrome c biogenesis protein CcdA
MLERFVNNVGDYIDTNPWFALIAVFLGGSLTASNPCVLAMVPLMMSFVAGSKEERPGVYKSFTFSLMFVLGLAVTFTGLGVVAAVAGKLYGDVSSVWNWVVAAVCVFMGLHLMEVVNIPIPSLGGHVQPKTRGAIGALLLGLLFGLVSAPCAGPILIVLLTYLAGSGSSVVWGGTLLLVYALGHSVLILIAGTSMGAARTLIENRKAGNVLLWLRRVAGTAIIVIGFYFAYRGISS